MQLSPRAFSISAIAIRRHIATLMLTITVIVLGTFFISRLQVDLLPEITYPRIGVEIQAPGIDPEVAVDQITRPLEEIVSATEGVEQIFSRTREGFSRVDLFFRPGGNIDRALNDTVAAFNRGRGRLPDNIEEARVFKFDPSQLPVYEFALTSETMNDLELRVFASEEVARELGLVPGVAVADVSGGVLEEIQVNVDPVRLQATGLTIRDVLDVLRDRNQDVSGGRVTGSTNEPLIRTIGQFRSAEELRELAIDTGGSITPGQPTPRVYLRDVADIVDGAAEQRLFVRLNGETSVKVTVQKQPDANSIAVIRDVKKKLVELRELGVLREDMNIIETVDESRFINNAIRNVVSSGVFGTLLAAVAVLLFLGSLRQTLIIVLAIPLSTLAAIILMALFGLSINIFSLGGLALGVGIVVDNSIVMLEAIVDRLKRPTPPEQSDSHVEDDHGLASSNQIAASTPHVVMQQAEAASQQMESALIASTSTNLVAVLPFLLLGGFISLLFNELILTISFSVAASILVAVTVVPALTARLMAVRWSSRVRELWMLREFDRRFQRATLNYGLRLRWFLKHRVTVLLGAFIILGGSSWLLAGQIPQQPLPRVNTGQVNLNAQFPAGSTLETNQRVMQAADEVLLSMPQTQYIFSVSGGFLFGRTTASNQFRGSSTITLKPGTNVERYITQATRKLNALNLAGIRLRLTPGRVRGVILNNSPSIGSDLDVTLAGQNARSLVQAGRDVLQILDDRVKSVRFRPDADPRQVEVQIVPDWERLSALGLSAVEVGDTIATAVNGTIATRLQRGERLVDVRVQLPRGQIQQPEQILDLPLFINGSQPVRLGDVAQLQDGLAPGEIKRINQRQIFLIVGNLAEGANLSQAQAELDAVLADVDLPDDVRILPSTARETNQALISNLGLLGGLATFLVFVVMAVQYNSLIDPLVIMITVPLALTGGIWGLFITGKPFSIMVLVGAVLLVGIVVNNAIIMVELANQLRKEEGLDYTTAILKAAPQRLRPVLMTTITTVLGMFPLALGIGDGAEFLQPLGIVVFAGLTLATLLTLFLIPCTYVLFHNGAVLIPKHFKAVLRSMSENS
jgi:multidrug efflux pump subunit AcrB